MRLLSAALIAVVVLGSAGASGQSPTPLQARVDALAQQIALYHDGDESFRVRSQKQAAEVLTAWNRAPHTEENRLALEAWLREALLAMMPGGRGVMPAAPVFRAASVPEEVVAIPEPRVGVEVNGPAMKPATPAAPDAGSRAPAEVTNVPAPPTRRVTAKPIAPPQPAKPQPQPRAEAPARSKWSRHPAAAPLEWRNPFRQDPAASPNPLRSGARHETRRPVFREASAVRVNLNQLRTGVRGYNAALRELQSIVMAPDCGVAELVRVVEELERLTDTKSFLSMYRAGLTAGEDRSLPDSPSPEVIRELARRRAEQLMASDAGNQSDAERATLQGLAARLASLATSAGF